ncbi:MAG: hypothetical protein WCJ64_10305 [Rhodospirillaceae bacterium]
MSASKKVVAFALGGLGGSNSHGVGFLAAALEAKVKPALISCTSGQIHWVAAFLGEKNLKEMLQKQIKEMPRLPPPFAELSGVPLAIKGMQGVFKPAYLQQMIENMVKPPLSKEELMNRLFPAQTMIPTRDPGWFKEISDTFNKSEVAIFFNSVNPSTGVEYVHMNDKAHEFMAKGYREIGDDQMANRISQKDANIIFKTRQLRPITPEYVEAALWLMQYGFVKKFHGEHLLDGAYRRQMIVRELTGSDTIFIVRPQSYHWQGDLPKNYFEMEDFKIEMLFNGSYGGEVSTIRLMNYLHKVGALNHKTFKPTELIEIEISVNRGFFDYFFESEDVYEESRRRSLAHFADWRKARGGP